MVLVGLVSLTSGARCPFGFPTGSRASNKSMGTEPISGAPCGEGKAASVKGSSRELGDASICVSRTSQGAPFVAFVSLGAQGGAESARDWHRGTVETANESHGRCTSHGLCHFPGFELREPPQMSSLTLLPLPSCQTSGDSSVHLDRNHRKPWRGFAGYPEVPCQQKTSGRKGLKRALVPSD